MPLGRLGRVSFCPQGTGGRWVIGSPGSGGGSRRSIGGLHHWRPSRGGQGGVFWPGMGCLFVGIGGVGCVGVQGLCNLAGWALGTCGARFSNGLKLGSTIVFTVRE